MTPNTVLVTGAGGFVGSAVVRALVVRRRIDLPRFSDGSPVADVIAVLRPGGSAVRLEELTGEEGWRVERTDLTDRVATLALLRRVRPRAVIHVAADRRIHDDLPEAEARLLDLEPLETLFLGLAETGGERLVHTSTASVLPPGERLDEATPLAPRSPYGRRKAEAERLLRDLGTRSGVGWVSLRLFNMFGRYQQERQLLPYLVSRLVCGEPALLSSGEQVRDFTDVDDAAGAYLAALRTSIGASGAVYHIGSGTGMTVRAFALAAARATGMADLIRFGASSAPDGDRSTQVADPSRARRVLGWAARSDVVRQVQDATRWWLTRLAASPVAARLNDGREG